MIGFRTAFLGEAVYLWINRRYGTISVHSIRMVQGNKGIEILITVTKQLKQVQVLILMDAIFEIHEIELTRRAEILNIQFAEGSGFQLLPGGSAIHKGNTGTAGHKALDGAHAADLQRTVQTDNLVFLFQQLLENLSCARAFFPQNDPFGKGGAQ